MKQRFKIFHQAFDFHAPFWILGCSIAPILNHYEQCKPVGISLYAGILGFCCQWEIIWDKSFKPIWERE